MKVDQTISDCIVLNHLQCNYDVNIYYILLSSSSYRFSFIVPTSYLIVQFYLPGVPAGFYMTDVKAIVSLIKQLSGVNFAIYECHYNCNVKKTFRDGASSLRGDDSKIFILNS